MGEAAAAAEAAAGAGVEAEAGVAVVEVLSLGVVVLAATSLASAAGDSFFVAVAEASEAFFAELALALVLFAILCQPFRSFSTSQIRA